MILEPMIAKRSIRSTEGAKATVVVVSEPAPNREPIIVEARASDTELDYSSHKEVNFSSIILSRRRFKYILCRSNLIQC